ncbi:chemotaxis protein CheA [Roseofilum capinflatum]|uniref:histidine kinase n=1 Tax=Roseofilum capinflatum BLCC-M114 TaxID=3022440 RepID=A0ABT7BCX8_9CYAN|nr:chemotaxis protein CheA [Roseofilum capinflatum]MDJ1177017.1 chemotaxis protein CheA [Roseofilum capinflatum BLCC-M114]
MSNSLDNDNLFSEFLDDYFVECEEHLTCVRQGLLSLESYITASDSSPKNAVDMELLNQLFRSFHTLKGLSGMVGVEQAEALAHHLENYLRLLRDRETPLSESGFDTLMMGTKVLEEVIHAYRQQQQSPDITAILDRINGLVSQPESQETDNQESPPKKAGNIIGSTLELPANISQEVQDLIGQGLSVWRFVFSPDADLTAQGINVNSIRGHLNEKAQVIHASPRMINGQDICFDFLVASPADPQEWVEQTEGLTWDLYLSPPEEPEEPEPLAPPAPPAPPATPSAPPSMVRVELSKLDDLIARVGDLVITRARLEELVKSIAIPSSVENGNGKSTIARSLQNLNLTLERQLRDLREDVMRVRLVPIGEIFARMQFVVRDLAREGGKPTTLEIIGADTEIDKLVVERMMDPLLHMVRNAISHGIEPEAERIAQGKPPQAKITLKARTSGEMVTVIIEDDGRGIDWQQILERGKAKGLLNLSEDDPLQSESIPSAYRNRILLDLLCAPGFSTKDEADLTSGRGVGMAVVNSTLQELGGVLEVSSELGQGTQFIIQLPLTLAIANALIIQVSDQIYAIPQNAVREVIEVCSTDIIDHHQLLNYRHQAIPLLNLYSIFSLTPPSAPSKTLKVVIVGRGDMGDHLTTPGNLIALTVDYLLGLREIVIRPLTDPLVRVRGISGATELGDGRIVLILDILGLISDEASHPWRDTAPLSVF